MSLCEKKKLTLPWHDATWHQLWQTQLNHQLPHALLLMGEAGLGKVLFADRFSKALLCEESLRLQDCCDVCHACCLAKTRAHPNILWIEPEKEGQAIKVDQIRAISEFIQHSSFQGEFRIVIIHKAHAMNLNAANALLKTLEEPQVGAHLLLISDQVSLLPATILSRCQRILFSQPEEKTALTWLTQQASIKSNLQEEDQSMTHKTLLKLVNGAPLKALKWIENNFILHRQDLFKALLKLNQKQADPLQVAARLQDIDMMCLLDMVLMWMRDLIWLQLSVPPDKIINDDFSHELTLLKERTSIKTNMHFMLDLQQLRKQLCAASVNLNKPLMVENLLIRWMELGV